LNIPGLSLRPFAGPSDYPHIVAVCNGSREADNIEWITTLAEITTDYSHLINCDPATDILMAEVDGKMVGYGRCWWAKLQDDERRYSFFVHLLPAWREQGIRRAMMQILQDRLHQIAAVHPQTGKKFLGAWGDEAETDWLRLLEEDGFEVVRYGFDMIRPSLDNIPNCPLPHGLEVRRGTLAEWRQIWEAAREAFRDHWGMSEWPEESFAGGSEYATFNPNLWQIAWDGNEIAGGVLNFINEVENEENERQRGYTETIFVRRPWRKMGVAKALIARSFQILKDEGMTEAALGVDGESTTGALHLYRKMGFVETKRGMTYRKPL
ncbi:MAG: GNAT family N-acetyltransferase, partial [Chloroflexi bacterium]|nr:GNAT family N-acetyltransferase [Chloroflexota bacterium]